MSDLTLLYEREELIKSILNVKDVKIIKKMKAMLNNKLPATMSIDELKEEVMQSYQDAKDGKGITQEEFFNELDKW